MSREVNFFGSQTDVQIDMMIDLELSNRGFLNEDETVNEEVISTENYNDMKAFIKRALMSFDVYYDYPADEFWDGLILGAEVNYRKQ